MAQDDNKIPTEVDDKIPIDIETLSRMANSAWEKFNDKNVIAYGSKKSEELAYIVYLAGYVQAWGDMVEVTSAANSMEELLNKQD